MPQFKRRFASTIIALTAIVCWGSIIWVAILFSRTREVGEGIEKNSAAISKNLKSIESLRNQIIQLEREITNLNNSNRR